MSELNIKYFVSELLQKQHFRKNFGIISTDFNHVIFCIPKKFQQSFLLHHHKEFHYSFR